ncbi:hypothetical protein [Kribbella sp. NPDC004875]|uniref:hypothetical protein n=1 Tax=Kribbella sp. NPDC004875 TaxID=3364107 RepID=UPI003673D494
MRANWMTAGVAVAALAGGLGVAAPAQAASQAAARACVMDFNSITAGGDVTGTRVTAGTPPQATGPSAGTHLFTPGIAKASTTWFSTLGVASGIAYSGMVILNSTLYRSNYGIDDSSGKPFQTLAKVGSGWGDFTAVEESIYQPYVGATTGRSMLYGLRSDGVLFRWLPGTNGGWRAAGSASGFSSVKTLALLSQTGTYDTFLATTRGGALYTIRVPLANPMKPVVKQVRSSGWSAFDSLVAEKCGTQSTLLTAIDKETGKANLYAVSHANGTATTISLLGQLPGSHTDPINVREAPDTAEHLFGE